MSSEIWKNNPAMKDRAIELDREGLSAGQIRRRVHEEFGVEVSRNAICGVLHRSRPRDANYQKRVYVRGRGIVKTTPRPRVMPFVERPVWVKKSPGEPSPGCGLMELNDDTCRWPMTDAVPHTFCGEKTDSNSSYCPEHHHASRGRQQDPTVKVRTRGWRY